MGGGVGLHDVLDVVNHVLRSQEYLGCEIAQRNMQHHRVVLEERGAVTCGVEATVVKTIKSEARRSCATSGTTVTVRWCSGRHTMVLNFSLSRDERSCNRTSSISHPVSIRKS